MKKLGIVLAVLLAVMVGCTAIVAVGFSGTDDPRNGDNGDSATSSPNPDRATGSGVRDVTVTSCGTDDVLRTPQARVRITNSTSKKSNYIVTVAFVAGTGEQIDTGSVIVNDVLPAQSATRTATAAETAPGRFTCKVSDATRLSAEG